MSDKIKLKTTWTFAPGRADGVMLVTTDEGDGLEGHVVTITCQAMQSESGGWKILAACSRSGAVITFEDSLPLFGTPIAVRHGESMMLDILGMLTNPRAARTLGEIDTNSNAPRLAGIVA